MRHLATIQQIADVQPIEGADSIEKVQVKGWWCVAKKEEFKVGDKCVYFEIDSLLPTYNTAFDFLAKGSKPKTMVVEGKEFIGYRLRTIKLRGQISQGLALPLTTFFNSKSELYKNHENDYDVSEMLGIIKYEAPIPAQLQGKVKGNFPSYIPKTDEERVQNLGAMLMLQQFNHFYITEKLDGSSATFYRHTTTADGDHFGVCSRNLELLDTPENTLWNLARKYKLNEILPLGYAVQGEVVGDGIQNNPLKIQGHDLFIYNVYNIMEAKYLNYKDFVNFCDMYGLRHVPVLNEDFLLETNVDGLLKMADGKSVLCPTTDREGIVLRPLEEQREMMNGVEGRLSFKVISNVFLLGERE